MKNYLFPHSYKTSGWVLLSLALAGGIANIFFNVEPDFLQTENIPFLADVKYFHGGNFFDEIISILLIVGSFLTIFSKAKEEDEYIQKIRYESLVWAMYFNYILVLLSIIFLYGLNFLDVMLYNLFTPLLFTVVRFNWLLVRSRKEMRYEE